MKMNFVVLLFSVVIGLFWSSPALRAISLGTASTLEIWLSVLLRILIVFGVVKFIVWIAKKAK